MNRSFFAVFASLAVAFGLYGDEVASAETQPSPNRVWLEDFSKPQPADKNGAYLPVGWKVEGLKMGVPATICSIKKDENGETVLRITCQKSTGGIICDPAKHKKIDLTKTPIMRWRWRVLSYPNGADGRIAKKDDQPVAIYLGIDALLEKKSLAYRWEGLTPVGFESTAKYGGGVVKVHYIVLRNQQVAAGEWRTETRNVAADFKRIYGEIPKNFAISIIGNSQYTDSNSEAEIDFIEFLPEK